MGAISFRPQPGRQEQFLSTRADIAIYGGAAGGGKSYALLLECVRHAANPGFGAVIFRRLSTQITGEGGLWDTSREMYPFLGAAPAMAPRHHWKFRSGAKVSFAHLQYDKDVLSWQGSQIPLLAYDELTHFSEYQFFYMLSRNRSGCGVRPYVRATTNPDAESWVAGFIAWWIDQETGFPIPERAGVLRWFTRVAGEIIWGDTPEEVVAKAGLSGPVARDLVKSVTFIPSTLDDNRILAERDPSYRANLLALSRVERERLLGGNWKVKPAAGEVLPKTACPILPAVPADVVSWVRRWDLAATKPGEGSPDPDATAGLLMGRRADGSYVIADCAWMRDVASEVRKAILNTAAQDKARFRRVRIVLPQDPGQAGKDQAASLAKMLAGHPVLVERETGDKLTRAEPFAAQWQVGNVALVEGPWNDALLAEFDNFPLGQHDDRVDAASGAFAALDPARDKLGILMAQAS